MIIGEDGNPPLEEVIEHFGIKGMRWGVRNEPGSGGRAPASGGPPTSKQIKTARKNVLAARAQLSKDTPDLLGKASITFLGEASGRLTQEYRANPDRAIAFRMTSGEKALQAVLALGTAGASLPFAALNSSLARGVARDQELAAATLKRDK